MKQEKEKPVKYYELFCTNPECNNEWISKIDDTFCPKCNCTILEYSKLR